MNSPLLRRNPHGASYVQKTGRDVCLLPPVKQQGRARGCPKQQSTGRKDTPTLPLPASLLEAATGARGWGQGRDALGLGKEVQVGAQ